ncbi:ABC transporter permease [Natrarchaeobius oligotrophus]|uniref:Iron ABC transporter permease n=1 Tax=Natrarchaeobius chitinivorans TaxID=1679083 RepID=A0A3N6MX72_NATCH|nr:ABC transporter permease subunit [Natrarchaeobius chitinivorans]RQH02611.1 iron ABC transporter permease [Natrarchaeobius chitinivorans]
MSVNTSIKDQFRSNRSKIYGGLILFVLSFFTILPILVTIGISFFADGIDLVSEFTLNNWLEAGASSEIIFNTVVFAIGSATLTTVIAVFIAWAIARTNIPFGRVYYYSIFSMIFLPPIVWESVWIRLLGRNGLYTALLPFNFDVYSLPGMMVVQGVFLVPLCLIILMPMFANVDNSLEEASRVSGGKILYTTRKITLPLLKPGILAAYLLTLVITLGSLRVPLMIGQPEGISVLALQIYNGVNEFPIEYGAAFVDGTILILVALPVFYLYKRELGKTGKFETVSGSAFKQAPIELSRGPRYALSGFIAFLLTIMAIIPVVTMFYGSISPYPITIPALFNGEHPGFTAQPYLDVLYNRSTWSAAWNSLLAAGIASVVVVAAAVGISWIVNKSDLAYKRTIDYLSFLPLAMTSVSLALGFIVLFLVIFPIGIYGTIAIVILAYITRFLPATIRVVAPSVQQIQNELLEAATISGAGRVRRVRTILMPLIIATIHAIATYRFAFLFKELPISLLLQSANVPLLAPFLFELGVQGNYPQLSAMGILIAGFLLVVTIAIHQIGSSNLS